MLPKKFLEPYKPQETEERISALWEKGGFFNPDNLSQRHKEPYSIILPPPNVTGVLHLGHAFEISLQDAFVRFTRMRGKKTLWIPGTDSAAIATQSRVEKDIYKKEGKTRHDIGREGLVYRVEDFAKKSEGAILNQIKRMGASLDWSRYAYALDEKRSKAVAHAFIKMYEAGLIYRGSRIVNWDPKGQTTISDDEIVHEERDGKLYTFRYWKDFPISISTTRPETKVGDVAVAVHPSDRRYKKFIGKTFTGEFAGTSLVLRVVGDEVAQKKFGTGAVGVTPAHSTTDWEISNRHDLPRPQVINEYAKMTEHAGALVAGLKTLEAREKIIKWLKDEGLLEKEEDIKQNISISERTGGVVEPLPKEQWFVGVDKPFVMSRSRIQGIKNGEEITLKKLMQRTVADGGVSIEPDRFRKSYFHWVENLHDWCISRQIWFGHRIPAWYHENKCTPIPGKEKDVSRCVRVIVSDVEPSCGHCRARYVQDPDVLDTWFSSALWTFSTLGWPEKTKDLKTYHPTILMLPGYEILFLWVSRMILMSGFHLGEVPFKNVLLHGIVRDKQGRKFSKSLGNGVDPLEEIQKYGADALRMGLIAGTAPGNDVKFDEQKIKGYKHFANKLWNVARFVLENTGDVSMGVGYKAKDKKIRNNFETILKETTKHIENYRLDLAAENLYHYIWHAFADVIVEESKIIFKDGSTEEKNSRKKLIVTIFKDSIKMLHPFMPFVTEEIWLLMNKESNDKKKNLLIIQPWPEKE